MKSVVSSSFPQESIKKKKKRIETRVLLGHLALCGCNKQIAQL